ncbi:MAG: polyamine aminopropyltransferase [Undibacterium sp.]|nr:polyamine aminopropyltransferase [Undibacterium sp.]
MKKSGSGKFVILPERRATEYNCAFTPLFELLIHMEGYHLTADCFDCQCDQALLLQEHQLKDLLTTITIDAGLTIVGQCFYSFLHANGQAAGVTGTLLLAESHIAIHTWPERNSVTLDVYVCNFQQDNSSKAQSIVANLTAAFAPARVSRQALHRGERAPHFIEKLSPYSTISTQVEKILLQKDTPYQHIEIAETPEFGKVMRLDGAMMTSERDEFFYHESLVHPAAIIHGNPRTALIVGGGDGGSTEELLKYPSIESITLCEIDHEVIVLSRQHLPRIHGNAFDSPRVKLRCQDGLQLVRDSTELFDLILLDLSDPVSPTGNALAGSCMSREFFSACKQRLTEKGLLVLHLGSPFYHPSRFSSTLQTLATVFPTIHPYTTFIPSYGAIWGFAIASIESEESHDAVQMLLPPSTVKQRLEKHHITGLQYYNAELHQAMFALPNYIKDLIIHSR